MRWWAAKSEAKYRAMVIEKLKYTIVKLRHERFGQSSERSTVLEQLELQLSGLDADAVQAETAAQIAAEQPEAEQPKVEMRSFARRAPDHPPFTDGSSQHARKMSVARAGRTTRLRGVRGTRAD